MRFLLALLGLAALILIAMLSFGLITLDGKPGSVKVTAPEVTANVATVSVGSENKTVAVPTVTTTDTTIKVPTITVDKPGAAPAPANTTAPQ